MHVVHIKFEWDIQKNQALKRERGLGFTEIEEAIANGGLIDRVPHPGRTDQFLLIVRVGSYIWVVPCEQRAQVVRMVTAYPSRKAVKKFKKE